MMYYKMFFKWGIIILFVFLAFKEFLPSFYLMQAEYENSNERSVSEFIYQSIKEEVSSDDYGLPGVVIGSKTLTLIYFIVMDVGYITFMVLFKYIWWWIILLGIYYGLKRYSKVKFTEDDFYHYQGYFRDILSQYSVDVLSYIDQFEFRYPSIIVAMILQLQKKGVVAIENHKLIKKRV